MSYQIISTDDDAGTITYEITHDRGTLQEVLSTDDYPTADDIITQIELRDKSVNEEVGSRKPSNPIPKSIKAMVSDKIEPKPLPPQPAPAEML